MSIRNFQKEIGTRVRSPVEFGTDTASGYFQSPGDKTRRKEVVVWILIALLCALNIVAFYVMWLKAIGSLAGWGEITQRATKRLYEIWEYTAVLAVPSFRRLTMKLLLATLFCVSLMLTSVLAEENASGAITGIVTDWDGVAIAMAEVRATSVSGARFTTTTETSGTYMLGQLPSGSYDLVITARGMKPYSQPKVLVPIGQPVRLDVRLEDFANLNTLGDGRDLIDNILAKTHKVPAGPTPRSPTGKPDLSGVWYSQRLIDPGRPEMTAWAENVTKERQANNLRDVPSSRCLPDGITLEGLFAPYRILQTANLLVIIYENELPRQIYLDGRPHPNNWDPTFAGHSVGHWEGDDLVVDTVGFNDKTWIDIDGHPHTEKLHITERYHRADLGHLEVSFTIEDPEAYKKPWTLRKVSDLAPETVEIGEYICAENNQDVAHLVGK
jgi:hypothetical protein